MPNLIKSVTLKEEKIREKKELLKTTPKKREKGNSLHPLGDISSEERWEKSSMCVFKDLILFPLSIKFIQLPTQPSVLQNYWCNLYGDTKFIFDLRHE